MSKSVIEWHEVKTRPLNDEEKEYYSDDISFIFDCRMPDEGQDILIATKYGTDADTCWFDDYGIGLEKRGDWEGVIAWAELPRYESEAETE